VASALAEQVDSKTSPRLAEIRKLVASQDVNRSEVGAYAIKLVYANMPGAIEPNTLNALATGDVYSSRSVLGDLLLHLAFTGKSRSSLVTAERFWKPVWDFNRLDVWDIKAIELLIAAITPGAGGDENVLSAWRMLNEAEAQRQELLNDKSLPESTRNLLEQYRTLGTNKQPIEAASADLETSPALGRIMRVLFAHPLWDVAEDAASVLSDMAPATARPVIAALLSDPSWKVRYGAIEAAFGFRYVDNYELFSKAVRQFYNDPNCRLRALCLENFAAQALASEPDQRRRWCADFSQPIKSWVKDEDCWVLEHVYRLFRQLDNFGDDYQPLLADGVSRLFEGCLGWCTMERGEFLRAIEHAKQARVTAAAV
jgi:hypothetical protein